jgi:hypothetical protein
MVGKVFLVGFDDSKEQTDLPVDNGASGVEGADDAVVRIQGGNILGANQNADVADVVHRSASSTYPI